MTVTFESTNTICFTNNAININVHNICFTININTIGISVGGATETFLRTLAENSGGEFRAAY